MLVILSSLAAIIDLFSIAGGGGSSSGGGGGGGGGGSSGGGFSGGSSSGGSGGGSDEFDWIAFVIFAVVFVGVWFFIFRAGRMAAKALKERRARLKAELIAAAAKDKIWEPDTLVTHARDTFLRYQKDWSKFDLDAMKKYMTPEYYRYNLLMMGALKLAARQNDVQSPVVLSAEVMNFNDSPDDTQDSLVVTMSVFVVDVLNDTSDKTQLFKQNLSTTEYYKFKRSKSKWLFAGIDQATANPAMMNAALKDFADQHKFFYSLDWGHLLLPRRGQLFAKGSFGVSDINNHIIGLHKDTIIQIYTYVPNPAKATISYLISQVSVPKSYGNIVVRRKQGIFAGGTKGLRRIEMEWGDFNKTYEVFASDSELATSFELLNPKFMEQLQALPFEINIEVVDNIVYLYSPEMGTLRPEHYETMLTILRAAFKEMRM